MLSRDNDLALGLGYGAIRVRRPLREEEDVVTSRRTQRWYRRRGRNQCNKSQRLGKPRDSLLCLRCEVDVDISNDAMNRENIAYVSELIRGSLRKR
jgi:hypothetical protein